MCQSKERNQGLLRCPHWPSVILRKTVPATQLRKWPQRAKKQLHPINVFTQHSACSPHFASGPPLQGALGRFYRLGGLLAAAFTKSLLDHQKRQIVWLCRDAAAPSEPSKMADRRFSSRQERAGACSPAEHPLDTGCTPWPLPRTVMRCSSRDKGSWQMLRLQLLCQRHHLEIWG
uniref:Uncharacterized protein n=1 Tax=Pipistrellus kuhlii TaxID=59472 RepID=A0A7J7WLW3_PIPKU|nr:hypothetical protein mPipKuh1_007936 [Pipistrellus kuhlii]